ncbi:hypothetical protein [Nitrosospira sp. Is2]|uniref:hypothetical protein n=1 Tax=Nitrosospira sp. Is2 TaxID=3080532 RepID=UPI0029539BC0|nr:hypothetical protein [Nitrosospira sp. Is2]WON74330.1 hypothetical protein R5L00_02225 [Nitrosospira sp. Is2]
MSNALIMRTAYVWVTPAFVSGAPVDHTWVTTYDNQVTPLPDVESVDALGERYWFCWGSFHADGNPAIPLRSGTVNVPFAECLVRPTPIHDLIARHGEQYLHTVLTVFVINLPIRYFGHQKTGRVFR